MMKYEISKERAYSGVGVQENELTALSDEKQFQ
jgi:hypothetical protein